MVHHAPSMAFWRKQAKQDQSSARPSSAAPSVEHAVLISITSLTDPDAGIDVIEDPIIEAIERADVGEFDGNEIGPDGATLYMYGPDADALWVAIESAVRQSPLGPGSHVIRRYGPPGAPESRIDLG